MTVREWPVPWEKTRPRDPYVAPDGRVWFVGQQGNYIASFDPEVLFHLAAQPLRVLPEAAADEQLPHTIAQIRANLNVAITVDQPGLVSVWGLNLTEDDSWTQAYDVGTNPAFAGLWTYTGIRPPRTYGAVVSWDF